jgi:hypothetical protein
MHKGEIALLTWVILKIAVDVVGLAYLVWKFSKC